MGDSAAADPVDVPESPEVIAQTVKDLTTLYLRIKRGGGHPYERGLSLVLSRLAMRPGQALQVAYALGHQLVEPIRSELNLDDPAAGIFFESHSNPRGGEFAAAMFVNMLLRERFAEADQSFDAIHGDPEEVYCFLGLLLAVCNA